MKFLLRSLFLGSIHAATWDILIDNFDTIILAVAFNDTKNGIVPYMDNGAGPGVKVQSKKKESHDHRFFRFPQMEVRPGATELPRNTAAC